MNKPDKIRVVYDVSFSAELHHQPDKITGVGRYLESIAQELAHSEKIELFLTGCYGGDPRPAYTEAKAWVYWRERWADKGLPFQGATHSRLSLFPWYRDALVHANIQDNTRIGFAQKNWRRALNVFSKWESPAGNLPASIDLFHSQFNPLPDPHLTGRAPRVLTIYDLIPLDDAETSGPKEMMLAILRSLNVTSDWAIAISECTKRALCQYTGIAPERVGVAPCVADAAFVPKKSPSELERVLQKHSLPNVPYFLSASNPQPRKNIPFLIRCFQEIATEPGLETHLLLLAGSRRLGWGHDTIDAQIAANPALKDRIRCLGQIPDEDLAILYSHCTAFVFPSLSEGFGLPPLEAMQCGAPVICSDATSLPEVTGDAAILIDPYNSRELTEAMRKVSHHRELRDELATRGMNRAKLFSWEKTAAITAEVYQNAVIASSENSFRNPLTP